MSDAEFPVVHGAEILRITPAPCLLADEHGSVYAGYALCEFDLEWSDGVREIKRDILPFHTEGSIIGAPGESRFDLQALGDHRPKFADPVDLEQLEDRSR